MLPSEVRSRREFLSTSALGMGSVALACLLRDQQLLAAPHMPKENPKFDMAPRPPHAPAKARAMISLFMHGGPSHVDLLDPKPELSKHSGTEYQGEVVYSFANRASKKLLGSPWKFAKHGQCGTEVSELLPHLSTVVDDIAVVRSMHTDINGHEPSIWYMNTGKPQPGRPALGSWLTYGLGSETQDLPAYCVLSDPGGHPVDGVRNWSNGWLPPLYQGTVIRPQEPRILNLDPPAHLRGLRQQQNLGLLADLNQLHLDRHPGESDLEARIASYELAARMQSAAKEALDISGETQATLELYGINEPETAEYGTRCLIARRLVERGVRFVQLFLGGQPWDTHQNLRGSLPGICRRTDKPSVGLVKDLKSRGLLDSTLVHWGGEIGRLPVTEGEGDQCGRDHNGQGYSMWLAGGGIKGGTTYGETDEFGHKAAVNPVSPNDYQATLLHLFGLDHNRLAYQYNGLEQKVTDNRPCRVLNEILA
jgi:hypothetical protein